MFLRILKIRIYEFFHEFLFVLFFCKVEVFKKEKNADLTFHFFSKQNNLQLFNSKIVKKIVDSEFVKTCDELILRWNTWQKV